MVLFPEPGSPTITMTVLDCIFFLMSSDTAAKFGVKWLPGVSTGVLESVPFSSCLEKSESRDVVDVFVLIGSLWAIFLNAAAGR